MEAAFSVATNNRFAFFMDDEDNPGDTVIDEAPSQAKPTPVKPRDVVDQQQQKADKSPKNKKKEIAKTKGAAQPVKNVEKKKEPTANEKLPNKDKTSSTPGNDKPRGFRDNKTRVANSDRTGNDQRGSGNGGPPDNRQQRGQFRNRGRLPSKENQENAPTGVQDDQYNNDDNSSRGGRSRWNRERGDRQGFQGDRYNDRGEGERGQRPFRGRGGFRGGKREFERRSGNDKR
jgi:plasminogen activator inhibitor 1 RNA-binding protein